MAPGLLAGWHSSSGIRRSLAHYRCSVDVLFWHRWIGARQAPEKRKYAHRNFPALGEPLSLGSHRCGSRKNVTAANRILKILRLAHFLLSAVNGP